VFAQLRDVLAAKDSPIVPEKNQYGRLSGPQRAKTNLTPIAIGKSNLCEPAAEGIFHVVNLEQRISHCQAFCLGPSMSILNALISFLPRLFGLRV